MEAILGFATRGRWHAAGVAVAAAFASVMVASMVLVFPPVAFFAVALYFGSAAIVSLTTLRQGVREGLVVMLAPAAFWALPLLLPLPEGVNDPGGESVRALMALPLVSSLLGALLPGVALAWLLTVANSQGIIVVAAAAGMAVLMLGTLLVGFDPGLWIRDQMEPLITSALPELNWSALNEQIRQARIEHPVWSGMIRGSQAANLALASLCTVFLARYWHAALDNPGGFGREFRTLRIDRRVAFVAAGCALVALVAPDPLNYTVAVLLPLALFPFVLQALAVAHAVGRKRGLTRKWFVLMYLLLLFPVLNEKTVPLAAMLGMMDGWLNFRARLGAVE